MPSVLDWHLTSYPLMQAADIYKFIHQSVFGPGHIIKDPDSCRCHLAQELAAVREQLVASDAGNEQEVEPLDPNGCLVRVNLRPLLERPDMTERLADVLIETAVTIHGSQEQMSKGLAAALAWCRDRLPEQADALAVAVDESESTGYPARHHSARYVELYRPAYRVVCVDLWQRAQGLSRR